jgi:lincosamide nucleotidyltransferase A/C/D/E
MDRMTSSAVIDLLSLFETTGIPVWLDGGWGVDALLQTQTRPHQDLDIVPCVADIPKLLDLLKPRGFAIREGTAPDAFVMADSSGLVVDIHAITFSQDGNGVHRMSSGGNWIFPAEAFSGRGVIEGVSVNCLSLAAQVQCHAQGYTPKEKDLRDMELLQKRFNIDLPPLLRRQVMSHSIPASGPEVSDSSATFCEATRPRAAIENTEGG